MSKYFLSIVLIMCLPPTVFASETNSDNTYAPLAALSQEKRVAITQLIELYESADLESENYTAAVEILRVLGVEYGDDFNQMIDDVAVDVESTRAEIRDLSYQLWDEAFSLEELNELLTFSKTSIGEKSLPLLREIDAVLFQATTMKMQELMVNLASDDQTKVKPISNRSVDDGSPDSEVWRDHLRSLKCEDARSSKKPVPVLRKPPFYPTDATQYSIEGWVELIFDVNKEGNTENIRITNGRPGTIFNEPAYAAVEAYVYCKGKRYNDNQIRVVFEMEK